MNGQQKNRIRLESEGCLVSGRLSRVRRDKTFMNASRSPLVTKTMAALCFDWYEKMAHDQLAADARTLPDWWHRPRG
jgi:hypothetical protein